MSPTPAPSRNEDMTTSIAAPRPVDPTTNPHLQGVFAPTTAEVDVRDLRIEG